MMNLPNPLNSGQTASVLHQGPQNAMQPGPLYSQAGAYSQGQYNNIVVIQPYTVLNQSLCPVGVLSGELVYGVPENFPAIFTSAAPPPPPPPPITFNSKKRRRVNAQDSRPYVKKPPNAFMLFLKEQRPVYMNKMQNTGTAWVNKILGEKWKLLSKEEQAKYYDEADRERRLHAQRYPDWSALDNYGRMCRMNRSKASKMTDASALTSGKVTQQAKEKPVTVAYVTEPSTSRKDAIEAPDTQSIMIEPSCSTTGVTVAPHTQSCVMESSTSVDSNVLAKELSMVGMLEQPEMSPPPMPQTQLHISEVAESQTAEPDYFALLEDSRMMLFMDMLESPFPAPKTQTY